MAKHATIATGRNDPGNFRDGAGWGMTLVAARGCFRLWDDLARKTFADQTPILPCKRRDLGYVRMGQHP